MNPFYEAYYQRVQTLHGELRKAMERLAEAALDWSPGPEMNSITVLVTHLTGAERYWIGDVALGEPSGRVREAEFHQTGQNVSALNQRLDDLEVYVKEALEKLTLEDLLRVTVSPRDQRQFTTAWALLHALEHAALHVGQVQLTRQLWDRQPNGK